MQQQALASFQSDDRSSRRAFAIVRDLSKYGSPPAEACAGRTVSSTLRKRPRTSANGTSS